MEEPPYKKNLERLAALQDRLSKVQKTAESLLATVSGSGGDYTDKLVYTDVTRASKFLEKNKVAEIFYTATVGADRRGAAPSAGNNSPAVVATCISLSSSIRMHDFILLGIGLAMGLRMDRFTPDAMERCTITRKSLARTAFWIQQTRLAHENHRCSVGHWARQFSEWYRNTRRGR
jgi:hypothetical protein